MNVFLKLFVLVSVWWSVQAADPCECGLAKTSRRIVGGTEVQPPDHYPWMVALILKRNGALSQFCGASLISTQWLLSAAHCFAETGIKAAEVLAYLADHDLTTASELPSIGRTISKITFNPGYSSKTQDFDVSVLKLASPVTFSEYIRPVCMPSSSFNPVGKMATVTGWGRTTEGGSTATKLREVQVPILTKAQCQSAYSGTTVTVTDNMICAGIPQGGKDSCQGDSGGPLIYQCSSTRYVQTGVVSFGVGCARPGLPGFYANVGKLLAWIAANVEGSTLCGTSC